MGPMSGFAVSSIKPLLWFRANFSPNIFTLHNRWNGPEVTRLYSPKKPFYFSILRDPISLFTSLWDYYGVSKKLNGISLQEFALKPQKPEKLLVPGRKGTNLALF